VPLSLVALPTTTTTAAAPAALTYATLPEPWRCMAGYEAGGNPAEDTGNGFYGMFQFTLSSWAGVGGTGNPADASVAEQLYRAELLQQVQGWGAWPVSSRLCGV